MIRRQVLTGCAVLVALAVVLLVVRSGHVSPTDAPFQDVAYRIVYGSQQFDAGRARVSTDVLEVHRPGLGYLLTHAGDSADGRVISGQVYAADGVYDVYSEAGGPATAHRLQAPDGLPVGVDLRLEPALTVAAGLGLVEAGGTDTVAGFRCRMYVSAEPLDQGGWSKPAGGDEARSCVSAGGHLLRDSWSVKGTVLLTHTARSVQQLSSGSFDPLEGLTVAPVAQTPVRIGATPVLGPAATPLAVRIDAAPPGLRRTGTFNVIQYSPFRLGSILSASERQTFGNVRDTVTLTQTSALPDQSGDVPKGQRVNLGALGTGFLIPGPQGLQFTVQASASVRVVVVGSLGERDLVTWMRSLTPVG